MVFIQKLRWKWWREDPGAPGSNSLMINQELIKGKWWREDPVAPGSNSLLFEREMIRSLVEAGSRSFRTQFAHCLYEELIREMVGGGSRRSREQFAYCLHDELARLSNWPAVDVLLMCALCVPYFSIRVTYCLPYCKMVFLATCS